jgi:hypothetical protein
VTEAHPPGPAPTTAPTPPAPAPPAPVPAPMSPSHELRDTLGAVRAEVAKAVVGQDAAVTGLVIALLCRGHVLLEGVPGVAKTLLVVDGDRRVAALAEPSVLTNALLADGGNAALALRLLGRQDRLVWYVPSFDDIGSTEASGPALGDLLPPWAGPLALQALVVTLVAALWRGRRLGRLVTEPLPVTVQAAEATRGRGRLYRRSRSYGHAAASLRAGTASRSTARLGLPRSAGALAVIDAIAHATGRPTETVAALLYGPPPTDDAGLTELARRLDDLESEVHRP